MGEQLLVADPFSTGCHGAYEVTKGGAGDQANTLSGDASLGVDPVVIPTAPADREPTGAGELCDLSGLGAQRASEGLQLLRIPGVRLVCFGQGCEEAFSDSDEEEDQARGPTAGSIVQQGLAMHNKYKEKEKEKVAHTDSLEGGSGSCQLVPCPQLGCEGARMRRQRRRTVQKEKKAAATCSTSRSAALGSLPEEPEVGAVIDNFKV